MDSKPENNELPDIINAGVKKAGDKFIKETAARNGNPAISDEQGKVKIVWAKE